MFNSDIEYWMIALVIAGRLRVPVGRYSIIVEKHCGAGCVHD